MIVLLLIYPITDDELLIIKYGDMKASYINF